MELSDKIKYCTICRNSKRDIERGIVCGLTNEKPAFNKHCADLQASAHDIAELEESMIGGSQKSAIKIITALIIVAFGIAMGIMWLIHSYEANKAEQAAQAAKQKIEALDALLKAKDSEKLITSAKENMQSIVEAWFSPVLYRFP